MWTAGRIWFKLCEMANVQTHEELTRKHEIRGGSDRGFGFVLGAFFLLVALSPLRRHQPMRVWALPVSGAFLLLAVVRPALLAGLNRLWTQLGILMGRVVTPVVTAILFYVIFTPMGFLFRLLGKDPLRLAIDSSAASYWIERRPTGPPPDTMINQF
jgi:hypothetical protein